MALDPGISLQVQTPQVDLAAVYDNALKLTQLRNEVQQQNALKALYAQPGATDDKGMPTTNTLRAAFAIDPNAGMKLSDQVAQGQEREAQVDHLRSETQTQQRKQYAGEVRDAFVDYDAEMKSGETPPDIAERNFRQSLVQQIDGLSISQPDKDRLRKVASDAPLAALRQYAVTDEVRDEEAKLKSERTPYRVDGKTVFLDKMGNAYDADGKPTQVSGALEKPTTAYDPERAEQAGWGVYADSKGNNFRYNPRTGESTTMTGEEPFHPVGAVNKVGASASGGGGVALDDQAIEYAAQRYRDTGQMPPLGMGAAAAKMRQQIIERAASLSGGGAAGADSDVGRAASTRADTSSVANLTRINDSASAYEDTAVKNFQRALSLAPKGVPTNMGPWINKWVQDGATALGDPNIPPYAAALLTGANEYAKVMSGSTGAQGSTVDSRREAAEMFSKALDRDQIANVINVAQQDMENKKASYASKIAEIGGRISHKGGQHTSPAEPAKPTSKAEFDELPKGAHYTKPGDPAGTYRVKQ